MGLSLFCNENYEEALIYFNRAINIEPEAEYLSNRGLANFELERYPESLHDFRSAIDKLPDESLFRYQLGDVYLRQGNYREAHENYDTALSLDPTVSKYWYSKGLAYEFEAKEVGSGEEQKLLR